MSGTAAFGSVAVKAAVPLTICASAARNDRNGRKEAHCGLHELGADCDVLRRAVFPFLTSTVLIATALLTWATLSAPAGSIRRWHDIEMAVLWASPFTSLGIFVLNLIAWITDWVPLDRTPRALILLCAGSTIGTLLVLPLTEKPSFELFVGTAAGAFCAGIWMVFNPDGLSKALYFEP